MRTLFDQDKKAKLQRMPVLRILTYLGMIAWRKDIRGEAQQYLRFMHPLSWPYLAVGCILAIILLGVPNGVRELNYLIRNDVVWW